MCVGVHYRCGFLPVISARRVARFSAEAGNFYETSRSSRYSPCLEDNENEEKFEKKLSFGRGKKCWELKTQFS